MCALSKNAKKIDTKEGRNTLWGAQWNAPPCYTTRNAFTRMRKTSLTQISFTGEHTSIGHQDGVVGKDESAIGKRLGEIPVGQLHPPVGVLDGPVCETGIAISTWFWPWLCNRQTRQAEMPEPIKHPSPPYQIDQHTWQLHSPIRTQYHPIGQLP